MPDAADAVIVRPVQRRSRIWRSALVADTDIGIGRLLCRRLPEEGFAVALARSMEAVFRATAKARPDVIVLGDDMPDMRMVDIVRTLEAEAGPPLLALLSDACEYAVIDILDAGAADCMRKPFTMGELGARLRKLVRNDVQRRGIGNIRTEALDLDIVRWRVLVHGRDVKLSTKEQAVLRMLVEHAGKTVGAGHMLEHIWGLSQKSAESRVRPVVGSLRRKLQLTAEGAVRLLTEKDIGYRLVVRDALGQPLAGVPG